MRHVSAKLSLLFLTLASSLVGSPPLGAADASALKRQRVVVIHDKAPLAVQGQPAGTVAEGALFTVDQVNGNWLWIESEKAFLSSSDVIPLDEAIDYCTKNLQANPSADNYWHRAQVWRLKGELDRALADMNEAVRLSPKRSAMFARRGTMWNNKHEYDKALADETEAIRLNPKNALAYHNRARAWLEKKDYDKSLADFDQALQLRDPNEKTLVLGDIEVTRGADSSQMVNVGSLILSERCRAWAAKGDYEKALADAEEAIRLEPNYEAPFRHRRLVWEKQGEWQKAVTELEETIKAGAPTPNIVNRLRATCPVDKLRNGREAVRDATKACESRNWKNANFLDTLAAAYAETGDFDKAIETGQKALALADPWAMGEFAARMKLYREHQPDHQ